LLDNPHTLSLDSMPQEGGSVPAETKERTYTAVPAVWGHLCSGTAQRAWTAVQVHVYGLSVMVTALGPGEGVSAQPHNQLSV
jgi:hypothetical protein